MNINDYLLLLLFLGMNSLSFLSATVQLGIEQLFSKQYVHLLHDQKIGLITNHTAIDNKGCSTIENLKKQANLYHYHLQAIFAPEHGLYGVDYAGEKIKDEIDADGIKIYSLHGATKRPSIAMLKDISLLVYDIQDLGSRSYTYISTLFYAMEEAAKAKIPFIVLDRPNPLGALVDGPVLEEKWRSFLGYLNIPYCHGLTVGELATYFNNEYQIGCALTVIPMQGWHRQMTFSQTGLLWIPTSPHIPEADSAFYYPTTGILGELQIVNIGIGYTLPFKVVGAPWIDAVEFATQLNRQNLPGVYFHPFHYRPFFGRFQGQTCHGVLIKITDPSVYLPVTVQFTLIGLLKSLYPEAFQKAFKEAFKQQDLFNKVNGTDQVYQIIAQEKYPTWTLRGFHYKERADYLIRRLPYLIASYQ